MVLTLMLLVDVSEVAKVPEVLVGRILSDTLSTTLMLMVEAVAWA